MLAIFDQLLGRDGDGGDGVGGVGDGAGFAGLGDGVGCGGCRTQHGPANIYR